MRAVFEPAGRLLVCVGQLKYRAFIKARPGDLKTNRKPFSRETAGNRDRRQTEYVEGAGIADQRQVGPGTDLDWFYRHRGRHDGVHVFEYGADFLSPAFHLTPGADISSRGYLATGHQTVAN